MSKMQEDFFYGETNDGYIVYEKLIDVLITLDAYDDDILLPGIKTIKNQIEKVLCKEFAKRSENEYIDSGMITKPFYGLTVLPDGTCYKENVKRWVWERDNRRSIVSNVLNFKFPAWTPSVEIQKRLQNKKKKQQEAKKPIKKNEVRLNYGSIKKTQPILFWQIRTAEKRTKDLPAPKEPLDKIIKNYRHCVDLLSAYPYRFEQNERKLRQNIDQWWKKYYGVAMTPAHSLIYIKKGYEKEFIKAFKQVIFIGRDKKENSPDYYTYYGYNKEFLKQESYLDEIFRMKHEEKTYRYPAKIREVINKCMPYIEILDNQTFNNYVLTGKEDLIPDYLKKILSDMNIRKEHIN